MQEDKRIDDIVNMLDNFTLKNCGHINIQVDNNNINEKNINTTNSLDCLAGDMACKIPTLFEGIEKIN